LTTEGVAELRLRVFIEDGTGLTAMMLKMITATEAERIFINTSFD
jgi:hypothetical protein